MNTIRECKFLDFYFLRQRFGKTVQRQVEKYRSFIPDRFFRSKTWEICADLIQ